LIYEFLTGYPPFWNQNPIEIYKQSAGPLFRLSSRLITRSRIVSKPVHFPNEPKISDEAKDIIQQFCTVDRSKRLGNISGGAQRVKDHPFFKGINWEDVYYRKRKGPILPPIRYPGDAQCFDMYPDEKEGREQYSDDLKRKWDDHFKDF
jgi:protein kinase A